VTVSAQPRPASSDARLDDAANAASWSALGTYVELRIADPLAVPETAAPQPGLLAAAVELASSVLDEVDATCSRFRPDSDLMRANRAAGQWVGISPVLAGALRAALWAARTTGGLVDPCLGELLVAAGYDRTFTMLSSLDSRPAAVPTVPDPDAWRRIELIEDAVRVPVGAALDLGAVGKGYAADLVALTVREQLGCAVVVSVGGDVRAATGLDHEGPAWPVDIAVDRVALQDPAQVCRVPLTSGALTTSSITARRWVRGGRAWHHVIDPRTGAPTDGRWRAATAYDLSAAAANSISTAALVLGDQAWDWLVERDHAARLVGPGREVLTTPAWDDWLEQERAR